MTQGAAGEHSSAGVSTVFPLLARSPPPSRQPHPLGLSSLLPPAPPPPFQARPWPPNSRSSLRERAAARRFSRASGGGGSAPTFATQGLAAWAPTTGDSVGLASPYLSRELRGAQCVSASVSVSVSVSRTHADRAESARKDEWRFECGGKCDDLEKDYVVEILAYCVRRAASARRTE